MELARVFGESRKTEAFLLLDAIDYPREMRPSFDSALEFWREICIGIDDGRLPAGKFELLFQKTLDYFPHNRIFSQTSNDGEDAQNQDDFLDRSVITTINQEGEIPEMLVQFTNRLKAWYFSVHDFRPEDPDPILIKLNEHKVPGIVELIFHDAIKLPGNEEAVVLVWATTTPIGELELKAFQQAAEKAHYYQTWMITSAYVSESVRSKIKFTASFGIYTFDELIDRDCKWEPYFNWIEQEYKRLNLHQCYIPLTAYFDQIDLFSGATEPYKINIDSFVIKWLNSADVYCSILGDFGTGKTSFLLNLACELISEYRLNRENRNSCVRIPIFIPLNEFYRDGILNIDNLYSYFADKKYKLGTGEILRRLNEMGRLVFLLDGFDEMAQRMSEEQLIENIEQIAKIFHPSSKIILTSRTELFFNQEHERRLFNEEKKQILYLNKLNSHQVERALEEKEIKSSIAERITSNPTLFNLAHRPLLLDLMLEAMSTLEGEDEISSIADIYNHAIFKKLEKDRLFGAAFSSIEKRYYFLMMFAWHLYINKQAHMSYEDIRAFVKVIFPDPEDALNLTAWQFEAQCRTLLVRQTSTGNFAFAHQSFFEYFVALKLGGDFGELPFTPPPPPDGGDDSTGAISKENFLWGNREIRALLMSMKEQQIRSRFNEDIFLKFNVLINDLKITELPSGVTEFMGGIIRTNDNDVLWKIIESTKHYSEEEVGFAGGNIASILAQKKVGFSGKNLSGAILKSADLSGTNLSGTNLSGANLSNANISGCNLCNAIFTQANLSGVRVGDMDIIYALESHPSFKLSLSGGTDSITRVWDTRQNQWKLVSKLEMPGDQNKALLQKDVILNRAPVQTIKWSPCGNFILLGTGGRGLHICSHPRLEMVDLSEFLPGSISSIDILSEMQNNNLAVASKLIALGGDQGRIIDADILQNILTNPDHLSSLGPQLIIHEFGPTDNISNVAFSPDGEILTVSENDQIKILEVKNHFKEKYCLSGHQGYVRHIKFNPVDSNSLYSASTITTVEDELIAWDINKRAVQFRFAGTQRVYHFDLSRDGRHLIAGLSNGQIAIWDTQNGVQVSDFVQAHEHVVRNVCLCPGEKALVATASDDGLIKIWDLEQMLNNDRNPFVSSMAIRMECEGAKIQDAILSEEMKKFLKDRGAI